MPQTGGGSQSAFLIFDDMNTRIQTLREKMLRAEHAAARAELDPSVSFSHLPVSLPERRAAALSYIFDTMPVFIGAEELIVGARTLFAPVPSPDCDPTVVPTGKSLLDLNTMPPYLNEADRARFFGFDFHDNSLLHNVADYAILLKAGVEGMIARAEQAAAAAESEFRAAYARAMVTVYQAFARLLLRYSAKAEEMAEAESDPLRQKELCRIAAVCAHIAAAPPRDYYEAAQLFWFAHIGVLCDNFRGMSYGRVDQFLYPYYDPAREDEIRELTACLILKFSDCCDLYHYQMGQYNAQHNITLGGVTPEGADAVNPLTYLFIDALDAVRLEEPEVACRINTKNPPAFLQRLTALSRSGLNTLAYYNDDLFIQNLVDGGIPLRDARDYAFDLCQDILIPGRCQLYRSGDINLTTLLLNTLEKAPEDCGFDRFLSLYEAEIAADVKAQLEEYFQFEKLLLEFARGNTTLFDTGDPNAPELRSAAANLMTALSFTSALFEDFAHWGGDVNLLDYRLKQRGVMVSGLTVAVNSLSSLRKWVFEEKKYTLAQVREALASNYEGLEPMRCLMMAAPRWGNDEDFADLPGVRILSFAAKEIQKYRTYSGACHLSGYHQPHPVFAGWGTPATPDGRKSGTPIPVSLSPAAGTLKKGATAAMRSAAKLSPALSQWNNCLMLEYAPTVFDGKEELLAELIRTFFDLGGMQHQPNCVSLEELLEAQRDPEAHKDLIIRMWGVSARFVTLSREVQNEFIARLQ